MPSFLRCTCFSFIEANTKEGNLCPRTIAFAQPYTFAKFLEIRAKMAYPESIQDQLKNNSSRISVALNESEGSAANPATEQRYQCK
jgi:hypothetical protein